MNRKTNIAVLLLAHGTPDSLDEIPAFLRCITGGRDTPESVVTEIQHRYAKIGRSPLTEITGKQADAVERVLRIRTYVGMRNWRPFTSYAIAQMKSDGVERAIAICLAPHNSRTSVGLYRKSLGGAPFDIDFVESWHDHPLLIRAFAEKLKARWEPACAQAGKRVPIIFTAHSVPEETINEGDPYKYQTKHTAELVTREAELADNMWDFAFQSQGMSGGAWLGPTVEDTILRLRENGHSGVFIQPIGFVCDHVEVLYDIDISFGRFAKEHGMKLWRAESLNDSPIFVQAVAELVRDKLKS